MQGACIVPLLQYPQDKSERFGNRENKKDFARTQSLKSVLFAIHQ